MDQPIVYFAKLRASAVIPQKRDEDAGYDVFPSLTSPFLIIKPLQTALIPTGIASACPPEYYFQIQERGSIGSKGIAKRCGVIDSGYRGEWFLPMTNLNPVPLLIVKANLREMFEKSAQSGRILLHSSDKAIAQAILLRVPEAVVEQLEYDKLLAIPSKRGSASLGSTDKG